MPELLIHNAQILQPGEGCIESSLLVRDGKIAVIGCGPHKHAATQTIDAQGKLLTPGLIDIHTHGILHNLFERSPEDLINGVRALGRFGVTSVLPTLVNVMKRDRLDRFAELIDTIGACAGAYIPGFHLEGPFLALPGAGAATEPGDLGWLNELLAIGGRKIAAMSVSPDAPGIIPVIERLVDAGVCVFLTHTRADVEQTDAAIDAGARHATHFYDVFPSPQETDPGVRPVGCVETVIADSRVSVDFIADGVHVHPTAIKATLAAKGPGKIILITDSNIGAGLPEGVYETSPGMRVRVKSGRAARIEAPGQPNHGVLAGSSLTMNTGIGNLLCWLDIPAHQVWAMGTRNPAALLGLNSRGRIETGTDADLVLWDTSGGIPQPVYTWVGGEEIFKTCATY